MPRKKSRFSFLKSPLAIVFAIAVVILGVSIWTYSQVSEQATINLVMSDDGQVARIPRTPNLPPNCTYRQIQCVTEPCNPVLVCTSPQPAPTGCYYEDVQCIREPCNPILVCASTRPTSMPVPPSPSLTPSAVPRSSCVPYPTCPDGRMCATYMPPLASGQRYCEETRPVPSPTRNPVCRERIAILAVHDACGVNNFSSFTYMCEGGTSTITVSPGCLSADAIYNKVSLECGGAVCSN